MSHFYYARHALPAKTYDQIDLILENHSLGLSETGREQARRLGEQTKQPPFDLILTSPFTRARQTAEIIQATQQNHAVLQVVPDLAEVHFGKPNHTQLKHWIQTGTTEHGESVADVRRRVDRILNRVQAEQHQKILLVAHKLLFSVFLLTAEQMSYPSPVAALPRNHLLDFAEIARLPFS